MSTHRTHRTRLARALAAASDIGYQTALTRVIRAADAGVLPYPLDAAGMRRALDLLLPTADGVATTTSGTSAFALEPRYYRLGEVCAGRLQPGVQQRIARAGNLGTAAVRIRGRYDPVEIIDVDWVDDDFDTTSDWWRRAVAAVSRPDGALPDPYPPGSQPDGYVPIDRALDAWRATGDLDTYEAALRAIIRAQAFDIDAHAHLGNLYLDMADPDSIKLEFAEPPDKPQQRAWLRTAFGHYQTAVGIAELALPEPYPGVLLWTELDNRPFLRALYGITIVLWRLRRFSTAEKVLLNMLWLNPEDNQSARELLGHVRAQRAWEDTLLMH
ncbi:hypothetical protein [Actinoplanes sp. ATCC 53533]|uniref:hypothetical protein n=1 Tax=Actinoplanes sp. ATCC 53533 TaxID=1288362 RepID=UPI000F777AD2|nr:hypothetical protein [Actinoplanes sp. ATCC 53533]